MSDACSIVRGINERFRHFAVSSCIVTFKQLAAHQPYAVSIAASARNGAYADAVSIDCSDDAGHMGSVSGLSLSVPFYRSVRIEVISMNVIHISVAVVVDSCRSVLLRLIDPHVVCKVRVGIFHRGVAHCNHNVRGTGCECPCILYAYISSLSCGFGDALVACVYQTPLILIKRVVERNTFTPCRGAEAGCDAEWNSLEVRGQLRVRVELQGAYFRTPCHCSCKCISRDVLVK